MKILDIRKEIFINEFPGLDEVSSRLDLKGPGEQIDTINWKNFSYRPEDRFNIAFSDKEVFLKYYIREDYVKAEMTESNQMVCEDSCVEFFVSPGDDGIYYNFEFNPIGTCLLGSGTCRKDSVRAPVSIIETIRRIGSCGIVPFKQKKGKQSWTITVAIPLSAFFRHNLKELKGKTFRANFYKCGDMLIQPHYLTWNPVGTQTPDYHQPEYFGKLKFV
jgi:hypothetical protein